LKGGRRNKITAGGTPAVTGNVLATAVGGGERGEGEREIGREGGRVVLAAAVVAAVAAVVAAVAVVVLLLPPAIVAIVRQCSLW